ncbi:glycosyl transferase [Mesorhizobium sp. Root157]|nr:glycosyl transferase [Mesorhizobium sp. Root157]
MTGHAGVVVPLHPNPVAAVIVTFNSEDVLAGLLDSLIDGLTGLEKCEVIVVDNNSRDHSVAIASAHPIGARIIQTGRNAGYAAAINIACATLGANVDVLILNPDIRLRPDTVQAMRRALINPGVGVVVPKIVGESDHLSYSLRCEPSIVTAWSEALLGGTLSGKLRTGEIISDRKRYEQVGPVDWATGAILLISAKARHIVGVWDESFFLYSEEVDFMRRVREAELTVEYSPVAVAFHKGGDTHANPFLFGLSTMNRVRDFAGHHSKFETLVFRMGVTVGELVRSWRGPEHRAALDALLRPGKWQKRVESVVGK